MNDPIKLSLRNHQAPGDLLMLSAAIRDLHLCYPDRFITEVKSSCPELWLNNSHLHAFRKNEKHVKRIKCEYPLVHDSDRLPYHFIHGFIHFLNEELGLNVKPTAFRGDVHLSEEEKSDGILTQLGISGPFWLINAGGKKDFTIKWWEAARYQQVVSHYKGRIRFVQVGDAAHHHPKLENVIDLRGKTSIRELMRLVYHAEGMVTPVSLLMHLAAAVETKPDAAKLRPCVIVAGGREPVHWEAYPGHQFIHTIGALNCCATGGCWRSRTVALGDGSPNDRAEMLCLDVVRPTSPDPSPERSGQALPEPVPIFLREGELMPRCMDMINADEVIRRIEMYFEGGVLKYLDGKSRQTTVNGQLGNEKRKGRKGRQIEKPPPPSGTPPLQGESQLTSGYKKPKRLTEKIALKEIDRYIKTIPAYAGGYRGKGIVICGGGEKYFPGVWVTVNMLRYHGCKLPIEVWYLGSEEIDTEMETLLRPLNVSCIDGFEVRKKHPCRILKGWELKAFALLHSSFEEVMLLDADNVPLLNPDELFSWPEYLKMGAVFWPDVQKLSKGREIWELVGTPYRDEPEFESGQIIVNKSKCWKTLNLALWLNEYSDFYYNYIHGDKETFHMAFRKLGKEYAMPPHHVVLREGVMYQHDFRGKVIFQHRNGHKWKLELGKNRFLKGFMYEEECRGFLAVLGNLWNGKVGVKREKVIALRLRSGNKLSVNGKPPRPAGTPPLQGESWLSRKSKEKELISNLWFYERVGYDRRPMVFLENGDIGFGNAPCEQKWKMEKNGKGFVLSLSGEDGIICELKPNAENGIWSGSWLQHEKMPIRLLRINEN